MSDRKAALITGGGRGIGLGIAKALAAEGFDIVVDDIHDAKEVTGAMDELRRLGAEVLYYRGDITSDADRRGLIDAIREKFTRLDVLVNNAGVAPKERADILEAGEESFDRLIGVNVKGPYFLTQMVARWMIEQRNQDENFAGRIVNISSISAETASPSRGDYCLSKAAVSMATKLWAVRLAPFGIGVYEVRPGIIATDMTAGVKEKYDKLIAEGLLLQKRWGEPADVGRAVASLARGDWAYSTGQAICVDGGFLISRL